MYGYARGIDESIDMLDALLAAAEPNAVIELAEHALAAAERALKHIDDSGHDARGHHGSRIFTSQPAAAERPIPWRSPRNCFKRELGGEWDVFGRAAMGYAGVLGGTGLVRYHELAEARWPVGHVILSPPGRSARNADTTAGTAPARCA